MLNCKHLPWGTLIQNYCTHKILGWTIHQNYLYLSWSSSSTFLWTWTSFLFSLFFSSFFFSFYLSYHRKQWHTCWVLSFPTKKKYAVLITKETKRYMRVKTFYKEDEANATPIPISQQTNMSFGTSTMILVITSEDKFYHI